MTTKNNNLVLAKSKSWQMFDDISPKYDLLNHLLSFGLHIHWRNCLLKLLPERTGLKILDLATGTADVLLTLVKNKNVESCKGVDLAEKMLDIGRDKIKKADLENKIELKKGDATKVPFAENMFDATTISFGIRNVDDPSDVLNEMYRVLKPKGRALILEFSLPKNSLIKALHLFYLRTFVPFIGWIFSGHYKAYKYLNQTIETFPYGNEFCELMRQSKFTNVKANPLLFGTATIYQGDKE